MDNGNFNNGYYDPNNNNNNNNQQTYGQPQQPMYDQQMYNQPSYDQQMYGQQPAYDQQYMYNQQYGAYGQGPAKQSDGTGLAIASMIVGIASAALSTAVIFFFLSLPAGIVALVLGINAQKKGNHGMAKAGIITGVIGIVLSVLFTTIVCVAATEFASSGRIYEEIFEEILM